MTVTEPDAIAIDGLSKCYRSDGRGVVWAVRDFSLTCPAGELTCVLGPSGCGKTTLLRLVAGLDRPADGTVTVHGNPVDGPPAGIAMVSQQGDLLPWRRVRDNVAIALELAGVPRRVRFRRAMRALRRAGLPGDVASSYPHELSGGMRQRVALARAICGEPKMLLMDEPFSSLDEPTCHRLQAELLDLWLADRSTVLVVTHNSEEAVYLADRIVVMNAGGKVADFRVDLSRPRNRLGEDFIAVLAKVRHTLNDAMHARQ